MIGYLRGTLVCIDGDSVIINVGGVGYQVRLSTSLLETLPAIGGDVTVHAYTYVREDTWEIYGFKDRYQVGFFRRLLKVSGIGPNVALAILSTLSPAELQHALEEGDITLLCRVNGVGKKTAQRLVFELKGVLPPSVVGQEHSVQTELFAALESLGYNKSEVQHAVTKTLQKTPAQKDLSQLLRQVLKTLDKE